jgi:hypothetical protein
LLLLDLLKLEQPLPLLFQLFVLFHQLAELGRAGLWLPDRFQLRRAGDRSLVAVRHLQG